VQSGLPPANGRYFHTTIRVLEPGGAATPGASATKLQGIQTSRWVARSAGEASWVSILVLPSGFRQTHPLGSADVGARTFDVEGRGLTFEDLQKLPIDSTALMAFLLAPYPPDYQRTHPVELAQRLFGEAFDLAVAPVAPVVRAAAFDLLAGLPGIVDLGSVRDSLGRRGIAIAIPQGNIQHQLIIDPSTGAVLEMRDVSFAGGHSHITLDNILVQSGWTDTVAP
jgi:hypothetical protein